MLGDVGNLKGMVGYARNCNSPSRKYWEIEGYAKNWKEILRNAWKCKELPGKSRVCREMHGKARYALELLWGCSKAICFSLVF